MYLKIRFDRKNLDFRDELNKALRTRTKTSSISLLPHGMYSLHIINKRRLEHKCGYQGVIN